MNQHAIRVFKPRSRLGQALERASQHATQLTQRSQNKESLAVQLKLNEVVAAIEGASNRLIDLEALSEDELITLHAHLRCRCRASSTECDFSRSTSCVAISTRVR